MPTFLHHHLHHGHPDEFTQILRSRNLRAFGFGIARTFVPLFLIVTYGGLAEALWPITVFLLTAYALRIVMIPMFSQIIIRWGAKHAMALSFVAGVLSLVMTAFLQPNLWWIAGLGTLLGASNGLFFVAYHTDLALTLQRRKSVKRGVGAIEIIRKIALALGPLVGGIIATRISEQSLFLLAGAIMASAIAALYLSDDEVVSHKTRLSLTNKKFYQKYKKDFIANFAMGMNTNAASFVWSILLFVVIGTYEAVGFVIAVSLVLSLVIISVIRNQESIDSDKKEIKGGSNATAVIHVARAFVDSASLAAGVNFFNDLAYSMLYVPYVDRYYKHVAKKDGINYVAVMEVSVSIGHMALWFSFVGLYLLISQKAAFIGAFLLAALATLFVRLISKE